MLGEIEALVSIRLPAYGKINLSLDVLGLRDDGYHELATVMQSIALADELTFTVNDSDEINLTCSQDTLTTGPDNLVVKAATLLRQRYGIAKGVDIHLQKNIPVAAGLGGGSSDAGATLKALNHLWGLNLTMSNLLVLASQLGADVPFTLVSGTALAQGFGEQLTLLPPVPVFWLVLVKPPQSLGAGQVYNAWDQGGWQSRNYTAAVLQAIKTQNKEDLINSLGNDLERPVEGILPLVQEIKDDLLNKGALTAMVSGSGPTVMGICSEEEEATILARNLSDHYEEIYITHTI